MRLASTGELLSLTTRDIERLSVLGTPEPLIVDRADGTDAAAVLRRVPTVTVLVQGAGDGFDVVTDDPDEIAAAVATHPLACLSLVSLLRTVDPSDVWAGLAAESATYATLLGGRDHHRWLATRSPLVSDGPAVRVTRAGPTLDVVLDRPSVRNAFNRVMRDELVEALELVADDPTIERVMLSGAGPSFCSGGDLGEFGTVDDPPTAHAVRLTRHPGWWMHEVGARVTVQLHGACIGAGIELPAFAGRVIAAPGMFAALPEVSMGLIPGAGGTVSITRRIGRQRCAWMALTGRRVDAGTALDWGLVDEVA